MFRRRETGEVYVNLAVADHDFGDDMFSAILRLSSVQFRPAAIQHVHLGEHFVGGQVVDPQEVHFGLELRKPGNHLVQSGLGGLVELAEALCGDFIAENCGIQCSTFLP